MVYVNQYGFGGNAQADDVPVKRAVNDIQYRVEEIIDRLNERDVVDARPEIEAWMLQAADDTEASSVRVNALKAVHSVVGHVGKAVFYNREDGASDRYLGTYFGNALGSRADALVGFLPDGDGLLADVVDIARATKDADVRAAALAAYTGVCCSFKSMTAYVDDPSRAAFIQSLAPAAPHRRRSL